MRINPTPSGPVPTPPMVYVHDRTEWQYKVLIPAEPLSEEQLNALGKEGWELAAVLTKGRATYFYFKRMKD